MSEATPFVSVIVPVYDDAEGLARCLRALRQQRYPREAFEVIVVDNGSTRDLAGALAESPDCQLETEARIGSYAARNRGLEVSKGDILAFTDSDCEPDPDWLGAGVEALEAAPACGAVGGPIEMRAPTGRPPTAFDLHDLVWGMPQQTYVERFGISATGNLFARRAAFDRVGPFDARFRSAGDCEWCLRMRDAGFGLAFAPEARVVHPTRSSLAAFVRRRRRIAGGYFRLDQQPRVYKIPRGVRTSIERIRRGLANPLLGTPRRRLQFIAAELLLYGVTEIESLRLRLGGEPIRG